MQTKHHHLSLRVMTAVLAIWASASSVRATPPDPDNAALVYYQALLLSEQLDDEARAALFDFGRGERELTDDIRASAERQRTAIEHAVAAARMQHCNWGLRFSQGFSMSLPHLGSLRHLSHAILADARILAADGQTRQAFERCLTVKQMGRHVNDETLISLLVGNALDGAANGCIRDLLGSTSADVETLRWLKTELGLLSGQPPSTSRAMKYERQVAMEIMRPEKLDLLVEALMDSQAELTKEQLAMADEEFMARNRQYYSDFITSLEAALSAPGSYAKRYGRLCSPRGEIF